MPTEKSFPDEKEFRWGGDITMQTIELRLLFYVFGVLSEILSRFTAVNVLGRKE